MTDHAKRYTGWNVIMSNSNPIKKNYRPIFFLILSFLSFLDYIWLAYNYISPCSLHFMALLSQLFVCVFYQHKRLCAVRYSSHLKESFFFVIIDQHRCSSGAKIFYFEIVLLLLTFCSLPYFSWFAFFVAVVPSLLTWKPLNRTWQQSTCFFLADGCFAGKSILKSESRITNPPSFGKFMY